MLNARELDRLIELRREAYREMQDATRDKENASLRLAQAQERFIRICQGNITESELSR